MPSSDITIQQFRVSFTWFETILSLLGNNGPDQKSPKFSFLGRNSTYESMFYQIQHKTSGVLNLTLPWKQTDKDTSRHKFWFHYLNGCETISVTPRLAWEGFVPFRGMAPYTVEADWLPSPGKFIQEAFYYPHGVAYVVTAYCEGNFSLDDAVSLALKIRKNGLLKNTNTGQNLYLDGLAMSSLNNLRATGWGAEEPQGVRTAEPFTIFTVVKGGGVDKDSSPNAEILRALERVALWVDDYKDIVPVNLHYNIVPPTDALILSLPFKGQTELPPCDVLYAAHYSRVVWFPGTFLLPGGKPWSLAAYHRNLTLASLQVMSLCGLILASEPMLTEPLPPVHSECLRRALKILSQLYGNTTSYHSYSARAQLDMQDRLLQHVNYVMQFWNMDKLVAADPNAGTSAKAGAS